MGILRHLIKVAAAVLPKDPYFNSLSDKVQKPGFKSFNISPPQVSMEANGWKKGDEYDWDKYNEHDKARLDAISKVQKDGTNLDNYRTPNTVNVQAPRYNWMGFGGQFQQGKGAPLNGSLFYNGKPRILIYPRAYEEDAINAYQGTPYGAPGHVLAHEAWHGVAAPNTLIDINKLDENQQTGVRELLGMYANKYKVKPNNPEDLAPEMWNSLTRLKALSGAEWAKDMTPEQLHNALRDPRFADDYSIYFKDEIDKDPEFESRLLDTIHTLGPLLLRRDKPIKNLMQVDQQYA